MADALIPLDDAVAVMWRAADAPGMHLRILPGPPDEAQRAWVKARSGLVEILDATGSGDAAKWWALCELINGWADRQAAQGQIARVDCRLGAVFRAAMGRAA